MTDKYILYEKINTEVKAPKYLDQRTTVLHTELYEEPWLMFQHGKIEMVHTGIKVAVPEEMELHLRIHPDLQAQHVVVHGSTIIIDSTYQDEIVIPVISGNERNVYINTGEPLVVCSLISTLPTEFVLSPLKILDDFELGAVV